MGGIAQRSGPDPEELFEVLIWLHKAPIGTLPAWHAQFAFGAVEELRAIFALGVICLHMPPCVFYSEPYGSL